jgi:hypothetical protein
MYLPMLTGMLNDPSLADVSPVISVLSFCANMRIVTAGIGSLVSASYIFPEIRDGATWV